MKICVTGGAGFIGSWVAESYRDAGHDVVVIDNLSSGLTDNVPAGCRFLQVDVTTSALDDLFEKEKFDVVNHHAAHMELRVSVKQPMMDAEQNILGSIRILDASLRTGVQQVIVASSGGALYGEQVLFPADEEHPIQPQSPYGVSKRSMEMYAQYYMDVHGLATTALRYTNVYGPRQNPHGEAGVIAIFLDKCLNNEIAVVNGAGDQLRDYVYASDVAAANLAVTTNRATGIFNVCTGVETSVNEIVTNVGKSLGKTFSPQRGPAKTGDLARNSCTSRKIFSAVGWEPNVSFHHGISQTAAWFHARWQRQNTV